MGIEDIEKDITSIKMPAINKKRGPDLSVKNAELKVIVAKALSIVFLSIVAGFGFILMLKTIEKAGGINMFIAAVTLVYLLLGGWVSLKLWRLEYIGWAVVLFTCVAGVLLPSLTMLTHGLITNLLLIMLASVVIMAVLWWIKGLFRIKGIKNIFNPG